MNMIPRRMMPAARRIYWRLFGVPVSESGTSQFAAIEYDGLPPLRCTISYNKYGGYCVPNSSRHRPVAKAILANEVWEPETIDFITANCGTGDIVHAGTYYGDFLPALSRAAAPDARVWAFEPNRENYRCAKITVEINDLANVVLTNAGLGAKPERSFLQTRNGLGHYLGGASRIVTRADQAEGAEGETVQIVTVDETVGPDRNVSVIQLDVEGYEHEALAGASKTIRRCLPILILEVRPNSTLPQSDWFAENILGLGYRRITEVQGNQVFACGAR
jgi:FkbM family methyltransferase